MTRHTEEARTNQAQAFVGKRQYFRLRSALAGQSRVCLCRLDDYRKPSAQQRPTRKQQQYEVWCDELIGWCDKLLRA
jgi:hypothetical protein